MNLLESWRRLAPCGLLAALCSGHAGCSDGSSQVFTDLRVYSSPYQGVSWPSDLRLKGSHHDHNGVDSKRILAYDAAGYDAIGLMDYSGNASLPFAWKERRWPPETWLPRELSSRLTSVKILVPNAEEVGDPDHHMTSPGLRSYIEVWDPSTSRIKQSWQYSSVQEMFSLIRKGGGLPCFAHPWKSERSYEGFAGTFCAEIYSAYAEAKRRQGAADFVNTDRNQALLAAWDRALAKNQSIYGIAVNDHFGPYTDSSAVGADVIDSGKILVLAKSATLDSYLEALSRGAFFAIKELAEAKDRYPVVDSISIEESSILIDTTGRVRWISHGQVISEDALLAFEALPPNARYVRAEVAGQEGTVVFTQPFIVRPVGDIDGDYDIDEADQLICESMDAASHVIKSTYASACQAAEVSRQ